MIGGGAILDSTQKRIERGPAILASVAAALDSQFKIRAEAYLVECIINDRRSINEAHLYSVGLAIYQTGGADLTPDYEIEASTAELLKFLLDEERIYFENNEYRAK